MGQVDFNPEEFDPEYDKNWGTSDPPTYQQACMGMMVCPHCGKAAMCGDVASNIPTEENNNMIPRGNAEPRGNNQSRGKKKRSGLRYLSADMLTSTHQLAEIVAARTEPDVFGKDRPDVVSVKLRFKGEMLLWTLRVNNPSLDELGNKFGEDETEWAGRQLELYIEEDNFNGKQWIRCDAITSSESKSKKGKA